MRFRCASRYWCPSAASRTCCSTCTDWLDAEVGRGNYADPRRRHARSTHATAWYFRTVEEAQAFVATFPMLDAG